ncbi:MAG: aminotransferase class V-fold PLP-dependent enzyme, partial [Verrucomicrobiae bacterium]|nr:aminotransferase class V-fold PLP-dependent enzyme [Verrucomicrobiae bacterium]
MAMTRREVFLDHLAGTPLRAEVLEAMLPFLKNTPGSASGQHRHGLRIRDAIEKARAQAAAFVGAANPEEIYFT